jgi:hypothetical protein
MKTQLLSCKPLALGAGLLLATLGLSAPVQAQVDNYLFTASSGTYTQLTAAGSTRLQSVEDDDNFPTAIPIGFSFVYDGNSYTSVYPCSNGYLSFNADAFGELTNEMDVVDADERPLIAPLWDDLAGTANNSRARYTTTGTAPNRVFTFEWWKWLWNYDATGPGISFQVKLYEGSNRIEFIYQRDPNAVESPSASIGLVGVGTGAGSFLSLNSSSANPSVSSVVATDTISVRPADGQVYAFAPPAPSPCPTPRLLTATVNNLTASLNWSVASGAGTFAVVYGPTGFDPATSGTTVTGITGPTTTINNLTPGNYQFYVRQECGSGLGNSPLSNSGSFSVACPSAGGLTVGTLANTTASLSWAGTLPAGASYTVIYGPAGFTPATGGTSVTGITTNSTTLTNLTPDTSYEVYVNINCVGGGTGTLVGPVAFTTLLTAPANDEPCTAVALGASVATGTTIGATFSQASGIITPTCAPAAAPKDVWYSFVASNNAAVLTLTGTAAGSVRVFTAPDCAAGPFVEVFCQAASTNNTGFTAPINVGGLTPGQRYYVAVAGFGSSDTPGAFTLQLRNITGTLAPAGATALLVYPNPSRDGQLTLRRADPLAGQATLYNSLGQAVLTRPLTAGLAAQTLAVHGLAPGLYTLRVVTSAAVSSRAVVLE